MCRIKKDELIPVEKAKRSIRLERRGRRGKAMMIASILFGILAVLCLLYCVGIALFVNFGTRFFLIWGILAVACGALSFLLNREDWIERLPVGLRMAGVICFVVGMLLFLVVEGLIVSHFKETAQPSADYVIILGAQWRENGPSDVLQRRLDRAIAYLNENPDTQVIVSGGQGSNETISEAEGMQGYLLEAGIAAERILVETQSTNTQENLLYSSALLDNSQDRVVLVTNNFHLFRAKQIAKKQGYEHLEGLAASSYPLMLPNNMLREFFGILKDFVVGNL